VKNNINIAYAYMQLYNNTLFVLVWDVEVYYTASPHEFEEHLELELTFQIVYYKQLYKLFF
jgi:hypothetical protein